MKSSKNVIKQMKCNHSAPSVLISGLMQHYLCMVKNDISGAYNYLTGSLNNNFGKNLYFLLVNEQ